MNVFRRLIKSKVGGAIALVFLALMFFAFAAGDITGSGGMGVLGGSAGKVATVGGEAITVNELQERTQRYYERIREDNPELTMAQFLQQGGLKQVLDEMIAVKSVLAYGKKHDMRVSRKLVDAEIARTPAFADATGTFSESQFRQILQQQRVSENMLREDFAGQIMRQHLLMSASAGARAPEGMVPPYAAMLIEQRNGEMIRIPSQAFLPTKAPTEADLRGYYSGHPDEFSVPEQRKVRYALVSRDRFDAQAVPTDKDIADAYKARAADYAAREARDFSQLIVPTEAQAKDIAAKAKAGTPLVDLAREIGLTASRLNGLDQAGLAERTDANLAKQAFSSEKNTLLGPVRVPLGWSLLRVEDVRTIPGKTLAQARDELAAELETTKSKQLFADFVNDIDGKLGDGATLAELAKDNGLEVKESPLITADGRKLGDPAYQADAAVTALLSHAFSLQADDDPQLVQITPDEQAAVIAPGEVVPAGPSPFTEVRNAVENRWRLSQGAAAARSAAEKILAALNKGATTEDATKQIGNAQIQREPLSVRRVEVSQQGQIPPPLQAFLTMKPGANRLVPVEANLGFFIVRLDSIKPEDPTPNESLMRSTRGGLSNVLGGEYALQLLSAMQKELDVTRNPEAIAQVEKALREANGAAQ